MRRALDPSLAASLGLSPAGLEAGLAAVLGGVAGHHATAVLARAAGRRQRRPALAVLAGNVPALAVQPLLPALALRRPLLLKSSSSEPLFAPMFVDALASRLPAIGEGVAALAWPGGDNALEAPALTACGCVLAYGDRETLADLARRAPGHVVDYGPKLSFAVVGADADLGAAAAGVARDVALFDQRGCLSVQAVFVEGEALAGALATVLAEALGEIARSLPPGPVDTVTAAAVQQLRGEAELRGALRSRLPLAAGTVIVEGPGEPLAPSPGMRTVRLYPLANLDELPRRLAGWAGLLQGAALAGERAERAATRWAPRFVELGISRCAGAGELQAADAAWHNGGRDPLAVLSPEMPADTVQPSAETRPT